MKPDSSVLKSEILIALAHPNRIRILEFLRSGPKCACEITPALHIEQSNLSRHMKLLVQAGVVNSWKDGQRVLYEVTDKRFFVILETISTILKNKAISQIEVLGTS